MSVPDIVVKDSIKVAMEELAQKEGWGIFAPDGNQNALQIQRLDEAQIFADDYQAWVYVVAQARSGSKPHIFALAMICQAERDRIIANCGDWT